MLTWTGALYGLTQDSCSLGTQQRVGEPVQMRGGNGVNLKLLTARTVCHCKYGGREKSGAGISFSLGDSPLVLCVSGIPR